MVKLANTLRSLNPVKVMVIGDLLLDTYTIGKARRISPEAPVAIVHVHHEEHRPGGAGNVVLNLVSLGAQVAVIGRIGNDWAGEVLCDALRKEGVVVEAIFKQESYKTPIKNRVIAENQQIVRVDFEQMTTLDEQLEQEIIESIPHLMQDVKAIAISDYGKGLLTPTLLQAIIQHANRHRILVITDPKGSDFSKYLGTTLIKPNLSEAYAAAGLPFQASLDLVAQKILHLTQAKTLMITRSEAGISLFESTGTRHDFPVHVKEVKDVTGAGDTVLAMLAYALANQLPYDSATQLCNIAASLAIEQVGCARVTLSDLAHRLFQRDMNHKVFDHEQVFVLREVLKKKPFHLLILQGIDELSQPLFQSIQRLTQTGHSLLVYIRDPQPSQIGIEMLASLKEVSFILIQQDNLKFLCREVQPEKAYAFEGQIFKEINVLSYLLDAWVTEEASISH
ncbi:Bifunctional protein hldE [Candidatus Protochlamydia naegleriophila]|uniref:Bifunctional protein hldE n=1 Tax=Candidatus Protochlamydia naegleriophila TaxID=389348 RepID=A0A0U5JBE7_9BACT|nr:bifunctional ADP-heptose synthase [Candidatus Protochlamydia naegleriophila]CUI17176.1 Bifunctional protein hldE [Candidatus Protochlamydia naegleriophila]